jgi:hypothetical protein
MGNQEQIWQGVYESRQSDEQQQKTQQQTQDHGRILAIDGCYDFWKDVIPHVRADVKDLVAPGVGPQDLPHDLDSYHLIAIGCPGHENTQELLDGILNFLRNGGHVLTTDWVLDPILCAEDGWLGPDKLSNHCTTGSEYYVNIEVLEPDNPLLRGINRSGRWNITGSSYVPMIHDQQSIKVLIRSDDLERDFGSDCVLFETKVGKGTLVHFVSHAYAQAEDEQGAQNAAMILANMFDLAVDAKLKGSEVPVTPGVIAPSYFRLRQTGGDAFITYRAGDKPEDLNLTRSMAKRIFEWMADDAGNPFHRYLNKDGTPILEFRPAGGGAWEVRVPEGSRNSFYLNGTLLSASWTPLKLGDTLHLHGKAAGGKIGGIELKISSE